MKYLATHDAQVGRELQKKMTKQANCQGGAG
jgi:hypothetical protein